MKGLLVPPKEWWPSYSSPSQQVFEYRYNVTPFPPLSTRGASFAARLLDSWGASLIGQISAMPLFLATPSVDQGTNQGSYPI